MTMCMFWFQCPDVVILVLELSSSKVTDGQEKAVEKVVLDRLNAWKQGIHTALAMHVE